MISFLKRHAVLAIGLFTLLFILLVAIFISMSRNDWRFVYALDDAYIHMAMAKNFAEHGVWGVSSRAFSSSSSSLLWDLLLSASYVVTGANESAPLLLNTLFAIALVALISFILQHYKVPFRWAAGIMLICVLTTSLPALVLSGMEHTLHALLTVAFIFVAMKALTALLPDAAQSGPRWEMYLLVLAPLLTLARYEGLFLVAATGLFFALRRRWGYTVLLGLLAVLPVALFGLISLSLGWYIIPNSVLLKASSLGQVSLRSFLILRLYNPLEGVLMTPYLTVLLLVGALTLYTHFRGVRKLPDQQRIVLTLFVIITVLHLEFARNGWLFRYEAYLIVSGTLIVAWSLLHYLNAARAAPIARPINTRSLVVALVLLVILAPAIQRAYRANGDATIATTNIYEQQYQMSEFIRSYYNNSSIGLNDIGAVAYRSDATILDFAGLASMEVAASLRAKALTNARIYELAKQHQVEIAIVYDEWYRAGGGLPTEWVKVGQWTITNNVVAGSETVNFYAADPDERSSLIAHLRDFAAKLPADVIQEGFYTSADNTLP